MKVSKKAVRKLETIIGKLEALQHDKSVTKLHAGAVNTNLSDAKTALLRELRDWESE